MNPATQRARIDVHRAFPRLQGESGEAWTNRLVREAIKHGVYRQCSIGWHDECSERKSPATDCLCNCTCHGAGAHEVASGAPQAPDATETRDGAPEAPLEPGGAECTRKAQADALREWVRTSRAELDQAQQTVGAEGDAFFRGVSSAHKNATRRADDIEAGAHTVGTEHQENQG